MANDESIPDIPTQLRINTEQRTPCVLVVDRSTSMQGGPIEALNAGLKRFASELKIST